MYKNVNVKICRRMCCFMWAFSVTFLFDKEHYALYSSSNVIRVMKSRRLRWAGLVARMGERRCAYRVLVEKPEGRRQLGRLRRRWEDNIKMSLREMGWGYGLNRSGSG
jgi:hypothetical protein